MVLLVGKRSMGKNKNKKNIKVLEQQQQQRRNFGFFFNGKGHNLWMMGKARRKKTNKA